MWNSRRRWHRAARGAIANAIMGRQRGRAAVGDWATRVARQTEQRSALVVAAQAGLRGVAGSDRCHGKSAATYQVGRRLVHLARVLAANRHEHGQGGHGRWGGGMNRRRRQNE